MQQGSIPNGHPEPRNAAHGRNEQRSLFSTTYSLLEQAIAGGVFPGCAFGVLRGDRLLAIDGLGRQTYEPGSPAIEPSTVYDLASLTKVLATTTMAMLLYDRQLLDLDRPLISILPRFGAGGGEAGSQPLDEQRSLVTLRHLLAHSSGLAGYARLFETAHTADEIVTACLQQPLQHEPGTVSEYSDIGFILLGRALEVLAGETIDSFCAREVFARLGMPHTRFLPPQSDWPFIPPTEDDHAFRQRVIQGEVQDENCWVMGGISGHAGLFGNVADVLKFSAALLPSAAMSQRDLSSLFRPDTLRLFSTRSRMPPASTRALGWDTPSEPSSSGRYFSPESIGHLGYAGTSLWIDLQEKIAIALLTNRTWPSRCNEKIRSLRPLFHDSVREALGLTGANVG